MAYHQNAPADFLATDSHFHLRELSRKGVDPEILLRETFPGVLSRGLDVGVDLEDSERRLAWARSCDRLSLSFGLSPHAAAREIPETEWRSFRALLSESRVVAVGETGLDWYWNYGSREAQLDLFDRQCALAVETNKPVIVHNREADGEVLEVLRRYAPKLRGVLHCFSSDVPFARACLDLGFFVSFAGNVTYPKNEALREAARFVPADRLLAETDAPYLAPQPHRGTVNHPARVVLTLRFLSELRSASSEALNERVRENFLDLFGIR